MALSLFTQKAANQVIIVHVIMLMLVETVIISESECMVSTMMTVMMMMMMMTPAMTATAVKDRINTVEVTMQTNATNVEGEGTGHKTAILMNDNETNGVAAKATTIHASTAAREAIGLKIVGRDYAV